MHAARVLALSNGEIQENTIHAIDIGFLSANYPTAGVEAHHTQKFSLTDRWPRFGEKGFWTELDDVAAFQPVRRLPQASSVNMKLEPQLLSCHCICRVLVISKYVVFFVCHLALHACFFL